MTDKKIRPFGKKDELGYVFGDMAGSFVNLFIDAYFLTFCTYVLGISPAWMGSLFLFARLWDAINDPIMGSFPDRWMIGKSGDKFKPWIKIFMVPLALSGILCSTGRCCTPCICCICICPLWNELYRNFHAIRCDGKCCQHRPYRSKQAFPCKKYRWNFSRYGSSFLCSGYLL